MRLILIWNLIKYGWPFFLIGFLILWVIQNLFPDALSSDFEEYLLLGIFAFTIIGAIYRWWTESPTDIKLQVSEQDVYKDFRKYQNEINLVTQWNCKKCMAVIVGTSLCRNCWEIRDLDIDHRIMESAIRLAETAGDYKAVAQGQEMLRTGKQFLAATKLLEQQRRIEDGSKKGTTFCPNCGVNISQATKFCSNCGTRIT